MASRIILVVFLIMAAAPLGRAHIDSGFAEKVPSRIKKEIDDLVEQKVSIYMSTFFGELELHGDENETSNIVQKAEKKKSRIRRANNGSTLAVDGGYSQWSSFGPCSSSCGGGQKQRYRTCTFPAPSNGGQNCSGLGPATETKYCIVMPCTTGKFILKGFTEISKMMLPSNTLQVKQFSMNGNTFIGILSPVTLQLYIWDEDLHLFTKYGQALTVFNAKSFDVFTHIVDHYVVLAESMKQPYGVNYVTRVLSYSDMEKNFNFQKQITLPLPSANKVVTFKVFGQPHVAFIQHQSKAPGSSITKTVCDGRSQVISCSSGSSITIRSAFYGRKSWSICNHGWFFNIQPCSAPLILEKVAMMCNNKTRCTLKAPTDGIVDPCPVFTKYLTVEYTCDKTMYKNAPRFYVWKAVSFQVIPSDSLVTYGATDIDAFALHHKHFVVVANFVNDEGSHHLDSEIFIYSSNLKRFVSFQRLRTDAAVDWEFFSIGEGLATEYFLAVANNFKIDRNGRKNYLVDSVIYKWNWNLFVPFQCIKAHGANKWTAIKGQSGEFLLALSTTNSKNVTLFEYDGWRFKQSQQPLKPSNMDYDSPVTHSLRVKNRTMVLIRNAKTVFSGINNGQLFRVDFTKSYPRYKLLNDTLVKVGEINKTLLLLNERVSKVNDTFHMKRSKIVFLNDNSSITGLKNFTDVLVRGDMTTQQSSLGTVKLSPRDEDILKRQNALKSKVQKQQSLIRSLQHLSLQTLSKSKRQTIDVPFTFQSPMHLGNVKASSASVSGTINGKDLSKIAAKAIYIDRNQTVFGRKTFASEVHMRANLTLRGTLDKVKTADMVTLKTDQVISGKKSFRGNLTFRSRTTNEGNMVVKGHLDGIPVSRKHLMTLLDNQTIIGFYKFTENVNIEGDADFVTVNGVNITSLYGSAVLLDTDQFVGGFKQFDRSINIKGNLTMSEHRTIDNVDVSELEKVVLSRSRNQNISSSVVLNNDVVFKSPLQVNKLINGINVSSDVILLSKSQKIYGDKHFTRDVTFHKNVDVKGLVNSVNISGDLMTVRGNQIIKGKKRFTDILTVRGNVSMLAGKTVDGVDLSELARTAVYKHVPQVIAGDFVFESVSAVNVTLDCNGSCLFEELLKNLSEKAVKRNKPTAITGTKIFVKHLTASKNITVHGFVNNITIRDEMVTRNGPQRIKGRKIFRNAVHASESVMVFGRLNGINVSDMYDKALMLHGDQVVNGVNSFSDGIHFKKDVNVGGKINGIDIATGLVKREGNEIITGEKVFQGPLGVRNLTVHAMLVDGLVDGINITEFDKTVLKQYGSQIISGHVTFTKGFDVAGNLQANGNINGINLTHLSLNSLRLRGNQTVTGKKVFAKPITVGTTFNVDGLLDGVNLTKLSNEAVKLNGDYQVIRGDVTFTNDVTVTKDVHIGRLLNGVNLTKLKTEALYLFGDQTVYGVYHFGQVNINGNADIQGKVNGIDLSKETVPLIGNVTLGEKTFANHVNLRQGLFVDGLVDNVNLTKLANDAVYLHGRQIIHARKSFIGVLKLSGNLKLDGFIDGVNVTELKSTALSKHGDQVITGVFVFNNTVEFTKLCTILGLLNNVNLTIFSKNVVTKSTAQVIRGTKIFNVVTVYGDVFAKRIETSGKINGVDVRKMDRNSVKIYGSFNIKGEKIFQKDSVFNNGFFVNKTVNGLNIPEDLMLVFSNQSISGKKIFTKNITVYGNIAVNPSVTINGIDVSELASKAVYLHKAQTIYGLVNFNNVAAMTDVTARGLINGYNISSHHLLLKVGDQQITAAKTFSEVIVKGDLIVKGNINGVDILKLNATSMFSNADNYINATKEIIGNLRIKGNLTISTIDGIRVEDLLQRYFHANRTVKMEIFKLNQTIKMQSRALHAYVKSVQSLQPKLDYYTIEETLKLSSSVNSFDAVVVKNSLVMLLLDGRTYVNSSIYKRNSLTGKVYPFKQVQTEGGASVSMIARGNIIHAAIARTHSTVPTLQRSTIYSMDFENALTTVSRQDQDTKYATQADITEFNNDTLVTFTNTFDASSHQTCVFSNPLLINLVKQKKQIASILGCNTRKLVAKQIDEKNFLLVSLNSGLYSGREAVIYKVNVNGSYLILQRLPTFFAKDVMFLEIQNELLLIIANEYQYSGVSLLTDYNVPVQIYSYKKSRSAFVWYQDLKAPGAMLLASFNIDKYTYIIIGSSMQAVKVFQFAGAGKFIMVDSVLSKGPNNIKQIRTWSIDGEVYVGVLSAESSFLHQNVLRIIKIVTTASTSASEINRKLSKI
eukprot:gene6818-7587_t